MVTATDGKPASFPDPIYTALASLPPCSTSSSPLFLSFSPLFLPHSTLLLPLLLSPPVWAEVALGQQAGEKAPAFPPASWQLRASLELLFQLTDGFIAASVSK